MVALFESPVMVMFLHFKSFAFIVFQVQSANCERVKAPSLDLALSIETHDLTLI